MDPKIKETEHINKLRRLRDEAFNVKFLSQLKSDGVLFKKIYIVDISKGSEGNPIFLNYNRAKKYTESLKHHNGIKEVSIDEIQPYQIRNLKS